jgi:hypothetical protein
MVKKSLQKRNRARIRSKAYLKHGIGRIEKLGIVISEKNRKIKTINDEKI